MDPAFAQICERNPALQEVCEINFELLGCRQFLEENPQSAPYIERCPSTENYERDVSFDELKIACQDAVVDAVVGTLKAPLALAPLFNIGTYSDEDFARQQRFANCKTPQCKRENLGSLYSLFDEKNPRDRQFFETPKPPKGLDCRDIVNKNACEGATMEVVYREALRRAQLKVKKGEMAKTWYPPWLGGNVQVYINPADAPPAPKEAKEKKSFNPYIFLEEQISIRAGCFKKEYAEAMACDAVSMVLDPISAVGAIGRIAKVSKVDEAKLLKNASEQLRRQGKELPNAENIGRVRFLQEFLERPATTTAQNRAFLRDAFVRAPNNSKIYKYTDNTIQKKMNDINPAVVTAVNNLRDKFLIEAEKEVIARHKNIKWTSYAGTKEQAGGFEMINPDRKGPPPPLPEDFITELDRANKKALERLDQYAKEHNILIEGMPPPSTWTRTGYGETIDEAADAARYARKQDDPTMTYSFSSAEVQEARKKEIKMIAQLHYDVVEKFKGVGPEGRKMVSKAMFSRPGDYEIDTRVFTYSRAEPDDERFRKALERIYETKITDNDVKLIRRLVNTADGISVPMLKAERTVLTLNDAHNGAIGYDIRAQGARNQSSNTKILKNMDIDNPDPGHALRLLRIDENPQTIEFEAKKMAVQKVGAVQLGAEVQFRQTGDEMGHVFNRPVDPDSAVSFAIKNSQAVAEGTLRMTYIPPQPRGFARVKNIVNRMPPADDLNAWGMNLEKYMRSKLLHEMPDFNRFENMGILIDFRNWKKPLAHTYGVKLTDKENELVAKAFAEALKDASGRPRQIVPGT